MDKAKSIIKTLLNQFFIILMYIVLVIVLQAIMIHYLNSNSNIIKGIAYLIIETIILVIFILIFQKTFFKDVNDFKTNGKKYIKENYKYWLYGLIVMAISNVIISHFFGLASNEEGNRTLLNNLPFVSALMMVIYAPITEELMTRVLLKDKFSNIIYYLLSGLIFGGLHLLAANSINEIFYIIPYGALGYSFAVIYQKSNNICTSMFFHALHNLIALILILFL